MNYKKIFKPLEKEQSKIQVQGSKKYLQKKNTPYSNFISKFIKDTIPNKDIQKKIPSKTPRLYFIQDAIPFMISETGGEIICIPKAKDPPIVGVIGERGTHKTNTLLILKSGIRIIHKEPICDTNDLSGTSEDWNESQDNPEWKNLLWLIGLKPTPLPIIQLYPMSSKFAEPEDTKDKVDILKICLSFKKVVENADEFLRFEGSAKYFSEIKDKLIEVGYKTKNIDEIEDVINSLNIGDDKVSKNVKRKIFSTINEMWREKLFDISNNDAVSELIVEGNDTKVKMPVVNALMYADVIPTLMTKVLTHSKYFDVYFNSILEDIYDYQVNDTWFKKNKKTIHIFADELQILIRKHEATTSTLEMFASQGRNARIALYWATQNYNDIPSEITGNTKYMLCMKHSDEKDISKLKKEYSLTKIDMREIANLNKANRECIALTKEYFIIYDIENNRIYETSDKIKGRLIPPLCKTVPPRQELK